MGAKCSGSSRKKVKKVPESNMPSPRASVEQYYSANIQDLLPNVQHSRPLYRFSNGSQSNPVDLNARIVDIREVEDDLRMESMFLKQNNNIPLGRSSTPDPSYCCHCDHKHRERCCLYLGDKPDDINRYSAWTEDLKNTPVKPQNVKSIPEAVSYNTTPYWFPRFTWANPEQAKQGSPSKTAHKPSSAKPFFQPFKTSENWQELLKPNRPTSMTPYQQYIVQLRQMTQDMNSFNPCQFDPFNPYFAHSDAFRGIAFIQQFNNQHIYNGPVYMQQNNYLPYLHHHSFPHGPYHHPFQQHQQPQPVPCPAYPHACPLKNSYQPHQPYSNFSAQQHLPISAGYANPAAQVHSDGVSIPLWMLFSYNQSKSTVNNGNMDPIGRKRCARKLYEPDTELRQSHIHGCNDFGMEAFRAPVRMEVDDGGVGCLT